MRTRKLRGKPEGWQIHNIAIADEAIGIRANRCARLTGASALAGGTLRCLAVAAGMVTVFGTPAAAQGCVSNVAGTLTPLLCGAIPGAVGPGATAIGNGAFIQGLAPTAIGGAAEANGNFATALGAGTQANGANATATGQGSHAIGAATTATGGLHPVPKTLA